MRELRCALESVDSGCPNQHYTKYVDTLQHTVQLKGHPLVCSNDGGCHSQLRFIRSAATHYPVLVTLSHHVYRAIGAHVGVQKIDRALCSGDFHTLMEITKISDLKLYSVMKLTLAMSNVQKLLTLYLLMLEWKTSCLLNMLS